MQAIGAADERHPHPGRSLADAGYAPLMLNGKRPTQKNWQARAAAELRTAARSAPADSNFGVRCGEPAGSGIVAALDFDIDDEASAERIIRALDELEIPVRLGRPGRLLAVVRVANGTRNVDRKFRLLDGGECTVQLLATGRQFVAYGVHPDTGKRYTWPSRSIVEVAPEGLPSVKDPTVFVDRLMRAAGWEPETAAPSSSSSRPTINDEALAQPHAQDPETSENVERLRSALAAIPADCSYDEWRDMVFGVRSTGWRCAENLAREWSMTAPNKWDEEAFAKVATSYRDRSDGVTVGTVFYSAQQHGWVDPRSRLAVTAEHGEVVDGASNAWAGSEAEPLAADAPGDIANAELFAKAHAPGMRYVHGRKMWMVWDSVRWRWCDKGEEFERAKKMADRIMRAAVEKATHEGADTPKAKRWLAHALRTQKESALVSMLNLARTDPRLAIGSVAELDADPNLLGVRNGVVDLRSGTLLQPDPSMLITRQAGAAFYHNATCPNWTAFLDSTFEGDADLIDFIQRAVGYTLTGHVGEEVMLFCFGGGANGKSIFMNALAAILGDYAITAPASMLSVRRNNDGPREDVARLAGSRLISANETKAGDRLDDQLVKSLVSRERIAARFLYGSYFEFMPTGKIWVRGNHKPIIVGEDDGIWRRIHLVPFLRTFAADERDPHLESKLAAEYDGILAWAVRGALLWRKHGLKPPGSITQASAEYRSDSDMLGQFLAEECVIDQQAEANQRHVYSTYQQWCRDNGVQPMSKKSLTTRLKERRFGVRQWPDGTRVYRGLRLAR